MFYSPFSVCSCKLNRSHQSLEISNNENGTMIGFNVGSTEEVKRLHKKVLELGGTCEGEPSQRGPKFSAYARDLDKNKMAFSV